MERVVADGNGLAPYDPALTPQHAVGLQPLACVLYAVEQLPDLDGSPRRRHRPGIDRAAVLLCGQGCGRRATSPASTRSTATPSARSSASTPSSAPPATGGCSHLAPHDRPDVVIEAVGHQVATLGHAIEAAAFGGTVFYFGVPDDDSYPISMRDDAAQQPDAEIRCDARPAAGAAVRRRVRPRASRAADRTISPTPSASTTCSRRSNWPAGRRRSASRSRSSNDSEQACRMPLPPGARLGRMGGRPDRSSGPRSSPRPATTTSDSTSSTAISTTPTSRCCCAGWSTSRSPPRCGCRPRIPRPIGRVLDAGADAVIIAMVESAEQAAAAVAATRYAPAGVRSFGPLRASLGHDPAALEAQGERVRDGRDRAGSCGTRRDLRGAGAVGYLRRPCRPGDLAGVRPGRGMDRPPSATRWRASRPPHRPPVWSPASTPAHGKSERPWPSWAFG